jgi:hypothetical protein
VILTTAKGDCYLGVFNWTDDEKTIVLTGIAPEQLAKLDSVSGFTAGTAIGFGRKVRTKNTGAADTAGETLEIVLPALHSAILKIPAGAGDFDTLRRAIVVK